MTPIEEARAALASYDERYEGFDRHFPEEFKRVVAALRARIADHEALRYMHDELRSVTNEHIAELKAEVARLTTPLTDGDLAQALYRTLYDAGVSFESASLIPRLTATVRAVVRGDAKLPQNSDDEREALVLALFAWIEEWSRVGTDRHRPSLAEHLTERMLTAGFHRQGPITDAQRHADELLLYVEYCLALPMYQNAISEFGQGAVETLRMVRRTLVDGLHDDARAAAAPRLAPDADARLAAWRAESPEDRVNTFPSRGWRDYAAARNA